MGQEPRPIEAAGPVEAIEAVVRGRVQGVGFRWFVQREAAALGLIGWVANDRDGSVRCLATGTRVALDSLIERLHEGPPSAQVDHVEVGWRPAHDDGSTGFSVRSGAHSGD